MNLIINECSFIICPFLKVVVLKGKTSINLLNYKSINSRKRMMQLCIDYKLLSGTDWLIEKSNCVLINEIYITVVTKYISLKNAIPPAHRRPEMCSIPIRPIWELNLPALRCFTSKYFGDSSHCISFWEMPIRKRSTNRRKPEKVRVRIMHWNCSN